jgi:hypothetical protein
MGGVFHGETLLLIDDEASIRPVAVQTLLALWPVPGAGRMLTLRTTCAR